MDATFGGDMSVTKEILLRGPDEQAAYESAREIARDSGVPIGSVLAQAMMALEREAAAQKRRASLLQQQRNDQRSKRKGM